MEHTRFRPATDADVAPIVALMRGYYAEDGYSFEAVQSRHALRTLLGDDTLGRVWVLEDEEGVAGYLVVTLGYSLEYGGRDAFIDELFLAERARGRGAGRQALDLAEAWCRERGVRALHLEVEPHRDQASELYRRRGFVDRGRRLMTLWLARSPA